MKTHQKYLRLRAMWAAALWEALDSGRVHVTRSGQFIGLTLLAHVNPAQQELDFQ